MGFVQASRLSERPRELLNQRNGARLLAAPVRTNVFLVSACHIAHYRLSLLSLSLLPSSLPQTSAICLHCRKVPDKLPKREPDEQISPGGNARGNLQACLGQTGLWYELGRAGEKEQPTVWTMPLLTGARVTCKRHGPTQVLQTSASGKAKDGV